MSNYPLGFLFTAKRNSLVLAASLTGLFLVGAARAQVTWTAGAAANWSGSANWSPNVVPDKNTDIAGTTTAQRLNLQTLNEARNFTWDGVGGSAWSVVGAATPSSLHLYGNLTKTGTGSLIFRSTSASQTLSIAVDGNVSVSGTGIAQLGVGSSAGQYLSALTVSGTTLISQSGSLTVATGTNNYSLGELKVDAGSVGLNTSLVSSGSVTATTSGLSGVGGTIAGAVQTGNATTLQIAASGTFTSATVLKDGAGSALSLSKSGLGRQTLTGSSSYTGGTTISAGTLLVANSAGSATGSGAVSVGNTATLAGTGRVANSLGAVTVASGGTLEGGTSAAATGALTIAGDVTLVSNSTIQLTLGPSLTHSSLSRESGTWSIASDEKFSFILLSGATVGFYDNIITGLAAQPWTGSNGWTITTAGVVGTFSFDGTNVDLTVTSIPEPQVSLLLLGAGVAGLFFRRRRAV